MLKTPSAVVIDDLVSFEGGPSVRRRSICWNGRTDVIVEPFEGPIVPGCRVASADPNCGIGIALQFDDGRGVGSFMTVLGAEVTGGIDETARRLPDRIVASVQLRDGTWTGVDVTEAVLSLELADLRDIEDGSIVEAIAPCFGELDPVSIEVAAAISFYFGHLPSPGQNGPRPAMEIGSADLVQCRLQHSQLEIEAPSL